MTRHKQTQQMPDHPWEELYRTERVLAEKVRRSEPFSRRRKDLLTELYDNAYRLMPHQREQTLAKCAPFARGVHDLFQRRPGRVLELGCGNGAMSVSLAKLGWQVTGVDIASDPLGRARRLGSAEGVAERCRFIQEDIGAFQPEQTYDCLFHKSVFEHLLADEVPALLTRWRAALRPGGWMVFTWANRLSGPHDCSRPFVRRGRPAEGSHFFETTLGQTLAVLRAAGFTAFRVPLWTTARSWGPSRGRWARWNLPKARILEWLLRCLPGPLRPRRGWGLLVPMATAARNGKPA